MFQNIILCIIRDKHIKHYIEFKYLNQI